MLNSSKLTGHIWRATIFNVQWFLQRIYRVGDIHWKCQRCKCMNARFELKNLLWPHSILSNIIATCDIHLKRQPMYKILFIQIILKLQRKWGQSTLLYLMLISTGLIGQSAKQQFWLLYLIKLIWRIKKYDWSRAVTWSKDKSSCLPPDVVSPCHVSRHCAAAARAMTS